MELTFPIIIGIRQMYKAHHSFVIHIRNAHFYIELQLNDQSIAIYSEFLFFFFYTPLPNNSLCIFNLKIHSIRTTTETRMHCIVEQAHIFIQLCRINEIESNGEQSSDNNNKTENKMVSHDCRHFSLIR